DVDCRRVDVVVVVVERLFFESVDQHLQVCFGDRADQLVSRVVVKINHENSPIAQSPITQSPIVRRECMERGTGIGPASEAWEASVLPLYEPRFGRFRWWAQDSRLRAPARPGILHK